jgi:hypothetical protein
MLMKRNIIFLVIVSLLFACTPERVTDPETLDQISTQVAVALAATRAFQATAAEATRAAFPTPTLTSTAAPSLTPTGTSSPVPTETFTLEPTFTWTPTETPPGFIPEGAIYFYVTVLGTGGKVGCGDDLVKLYTGHIRTGDTGRDLTLALDTLFSAGGYPGGFYNATYPSSLRVQEVIFDGGTATVYLDGSYVVPKDSCDASRYRSQVWATGLQFGEVTHFIPFVGAKLLGDRLAIYSDSGD